MMLEPGRPARVGWTVLGGTVAVVALALWMLSDGGTGASALAKSRDQLRSLRGK